MTPLAATENLVVEYRSRGRRLRALDDVSLALAPGESLGIVGESGSGKSTLARALLALVAPTAGLVRFKGEDLATLSKAALRRRRRELTLVFQHPAASLDPRLTVGESVAEPLTVHEPALDAAARAARVAALLERVGLDPSHAARRPHELSGGQCQRAAIARALITRPELVVCDEAVSALDASVQAQIVNLLLGLMRTEHLALVFISHDLAVVRRIASRVVVLYRGQLLESAPRGALYERPRHPYTRLLLDSVMTLEGRPSRAAGTPPDVESPFARPAGCVFAGRCPHVLARCQSERPPLETTEEGATVACFRWREGVAR